MNRPVLDHWSVREQLCLASAVSCSGDQNWVSVSRNIKTVCGNNSYSADWFSQKSCALQYAHLLENVETPKRKKRTTESSSRVSSPATEVEIPTDSVLRRLTEERIEELKSEIRKDQEEYAKIHAELQKIQSLDVTEEVLQQMWLEIEQEQEEQRAAEVKLETQMREREQRRQDLQRNWRLGVGTGTTQAAKSENIAVVTDVDVKEIIGVNKPITTTVGQQQQQQQATTSPLLSSLLKSPTATIPPTLPSTAATTSRTSAPTIIHTLLTSGSIPNSDQPAITLNTDLIPPEKAVKLLTRPISGPPTGDSTSTLAHNLLSPSQSAPTLSMLLEKSKTTTTATTASASASNQEAQVGGGGGVVKSDNSIKPTESETKEKSVKVAADDATTTQQPSKAINNTMNVDSDEPDPNEEQQLLEVFSNIGNIELDIDVAAVINDEEVNFLENVDDNSPASAVESIDLDNKMDVDEPESAPKEDVKEEKKATENKEKDQIQTTVEQPPKEAKEEAKASKIETSSDDSNDNIPLAAVATLENKERSQMASTYEETENKSNENKVKLELAIKSEDSQAEHVSETRISTAAENEDKIESIKTEQQNEDQSEPEKVSVLAQESDSVGDVLKDIIDQVEKKVKEEKLYEEETDEKQAEQLPVSTNDEKPMKKEQDTTEENLVPDDEEKKTEPPLPTAQNNDKVVDGAGVTTPHPTIDEPSSSSTPTNSQENANANTNESTTSLPPPPPSIISVPDTDEDSCTTDISVITTSNKQREEKPATRNASERAASQTRKGSSSVNESQTPKSTEDSSDSSSGNRISKRSLLSILNNLSSTKSAHAIQNALNDEQIKSNYQKICYRRLDFATIKKNIENGTIRSVIDLQRDLLQFAQNINFLFHSSSANYKAAEIFKHEMQSVREFFFNAHEFEAKTEKEVKEIKQAASVRQGRTGSRKSLRIS